MPSHRHADLAALALTVFAVVAIGLPPQPGAASGTRIRELAGPGYLPQGAPLRPPPLPPPRGGATAIDFDLLAGFDYDPEADVIPDEILALDGKEVELAGVMYYAVADPDRVTEFFLMPNHMICCFGTPRLNEAVEVVQRKGVSTQYLLNYFLVRGRLRVGQVVDDDGRVICLYRITDAEAEVLE
ncbi:MAG: DUF3299 domain-containing protein [Planctomycetota bacterium]